MDLREKMFLTEERRKFHNKVLPNLGLLSDISTSKECYMAGHVRRMEHM
jgi:hypothetical protein